MTAEPEYPTFYDEVLAHIPMDRWVTFKELWAVLKPRKICRQCLKTSLRRARTEGIVIAEDTGIRKQNLPNDPRNKPVPVYRYLRVSAQRVVTTKFKRKNLGSMGNNSMARKTIQRGTKKLRGLPPEPKKVYLPVTTKLDPDKVRQIRLLKGLASISARAEMFGVHKTAIANIDRGITWKHVK